MRRPGSTEAPGCAGPRGDRAEVRGVDLLEFEGGLVTRKDSFWKIVR